MKKIIAIIFSNKIIGSAVLIILTLLILNTSTVIEIKGLTPETILADDNVGVYSADADGILAACQTIANYYKDKNYYYDKDSGGYNIRYLEQTNNYSCCTIFAQQALFLTGILDIEESRWEDIWMSKDFGDWLIQNPKWYKLKDDDEEAPGDVHVFYAEDPNGDTIKSHTNIYAGEGQYWDAGEEGAGAFIGTTKTHGQDYTYGIFRYIGSSE